jgi:hypothetical protein
VFNEDILAIIEQYNDDNTCISTIASQIARAYVVFVGSNIRNVLFCGGITSHCLTVLNICSAQQLERKDRSRESHRSMDDGIVSL